MRWVECGEAELEGIREIFNEAILHSTALYEYEPRTPEFMEGWWKGKRAGNYPVIGVGSEEGELMGFGSYGPFRSYPAYQHTVEHSVYVAAPYRGLGLGRALLERLLERAREQGYHVMIGVIDAENGASIALHRGMGFEECGRLRETGFKFGRWLDLALYQRILE